MQLKLLVFVVVVIKRIARQSILICRSQESKINHVKKLGCLGLCNERLLALIVTLLPLFYNSKLSKLRSTTLVRSRYNNIVFLYRELGHVIGGL